MRGPKIEQISSNKKIGNFLNSTKLRSFLIVCVVASLFTFLMTINNSATLGIEISSMQQKIEDLQEANNELDVQISSLRSISRVEELASQLNMVAVEQYGYISGDTAVAVK